MDLKTLGKDLSTLQARQEKYEDALIDGTVDEKFARDMVDYYRAEASKVRAKYLDLVGVVKAELTKDN